MGRKVFLDVFLVNEIAKINGRISTYLGLIEDFQP